MEESKGTYRQIALYNKYKQIKEKVMAGELPYSELEKYSHIFRTEVRIKNDRLNSNIYSNRYSDKKLETYYNSEVTTQIYTEFVEKFFGHNDFYRVDKAIKIIKADKSIKNSIKDKLCRLIKLINKYGYTKAKQKWVKKYCENTFRNHKQMIEALGINLLTFDKIIDNEVIKIDSIDNFTLLDNTVCE